MTVAGAYKLTFFLSNIRSCNDTPNFPFIFHGQSLWRSHSSDKAPLAQMFPRFHRSAEPNPQRYTRSYARLRSLPHPVPLRFRFHSHSCFQSLCARYVFPVHRSVPLENRVSVNVIKWLGNMKSHHFPVSGHGIFSVARLRESCKISHWFFHRCDILQLF